VGAVALLSETLRRLADFTQVVLTSGNHDSATRLGFGAALMRPEIHLVTSLDAVGRPVVFASDDGPGALVYPLPFLDVDAARGPLAPATEPLPRSHEAVLAAAMDRVRADVAGRGQPRPAVIVMAHAFVVGGEPTDSERDIRVGGVDSVPAGVFAGADYVALGHLHGPQEIHSPGPVLRYCGSPLAFSFAEAKHRKSVALVEVEPGSVTVELIGMSVPRPLSEACGRLAQLEGPSFDAQTDDWIKVTVTDPVRPPDLAARVRRRFPHVLVTTYDPTRTGSLSDASVVSAASDPLQVGAEFVEAAGGARPTLAERAALAASLETVLAAERSA
jgi:exonuclease SbcD